MTRRVQFVSPIAAPERPPTLAEQWDRLREKYAAAPEPSPDPEPSELLAKTDASIARLEALTLAEQRRNDAHALEHLDRLARLLRDRDPKLTRAQAFAKACDANPAWYAAHVRHQQRAAAQLDEVTIERGRIADREIDARATAIAKAQGLTHAAAVARVCALAPELYERSRAGQDALRTRLESSPPPSPSSAETRIEKAAEKLREADPSLSKQQAIAKALENDPDLYAAYRAEEG